MCRIYGLLGQHKITQEQLAAVAHLQIKGGPDYQSHIINNHWIIGNNRLAIQDLQGWFQPFKLKNTYAVYNGEIYNHAELRNFLKTKGYHFTDHCEGSVILPLYELYGNNFAKYLDGMFVIAIIDDDNKKCIITNDPCAIKSIYFHWDQKEDVFYFSSELQSLLAFNITRDLRVEAVDEYLIGRTIWHDHTFFSNINSLAPSTFLIKQQGQAPQFFKYESLIKKEWEEPFDFDKSATALNNLLEVEIAQMTKADVPLCVVTSGGLDSSYISALSAQHVENLTCFNIAYEGDWPLDERHFAKEVALKQRANYHQVIIKEKDFPSILENTIQYLGQPNSAPHALSTFALFKAIHEAGFKVALTGDGADEFFSGYERFKNAVFTQTPNWLALYFNKMCATTQEMHNFIYNLNYQNYLIDNQYNLLTTAKMKIEKNEQKYKSRLKALLDFDQNERFTSYILRRVDHLSMANSVEVRVPFCQPRITAFAKALPDQYLTDPHSVKRILYRAAEKILPQSVLTRPKQPFTLPIQKMLKKGHILFDILYETLTSKKFIARGFFCNKNIHHLIKKQLSHPAEDVANMLWSLLILELWLQQLNSNLSFHQHNMVNCISTENLMN